MHMVYLVGVAHAHGVLGGGGTCIRMHHILYQLPWSRYNS